MLCTFILHRAIIKLDIFIVQKEREFMTDDTKLLYKNYTEEEPYDGNCYPPNYWICEKGLGITLQEFANSHDLTYEGVRRKILKYKDELIPHIRIRSGTQYLDDVAVDFLERRGRKKTIKSEIIDTNVLKELQQQIATLTKENQSLKTECQNLTNQLNKKTTEYEELDEEIDSLKRLNSMLSTEMLIKDRRNKHIQDIQFRMLLESGVLTSEKREILLNAEHWDGIERPVKPSTPLSLDDEYDNFDEENK